jgi:hypothetical protein
MKFGQIFLLTAALLLAGGLYAAEGQTPVAVAESESFEAVGRLEDEGLVFYIDRSDSNAPVLGATLEVDSAGKSAKAVFRAERGDYLVADAEWLKPLRQPGQYPLGLTLIAGDAVAHEGHDHADEKKPAVIVGNTPQRLPDGAVFLPKSAQRSMGVLTQPVG